MKKRSLLAVALVFFSLLSQAQFIEKGKRILGGSLSLGFNAINDSTQAGGNEVTIRNFSVSLSPSFGKAIKPDLVFGYFGSVGFNSYRLEQSQYFSENKSNGYHFGGGLFLEKFFSIGNRLAISGRLSGGADYSAFTNKFFVQNAETQTNTSKNLSIGISLAPSLNFKLSRKLLVGLYANDFASIGFVKSSLESSGPNTNPSKSEHSSFSASTMFNYGKLLKDVSFSFRFLL
jgi:hypothetical protein